jgi:hypothetical protein
MMGKLNGAFGESFGQGGQAARQAEIKQADDKTLPGCMFAGKSL